jgi:hypothetical protein
VTVTCADTRLPPARIILLVLAIPAMLSILLARNGDEDDKAKTTKGWIRDVEEMWIPIAWEYVSPC